MATYLEHQGIRAGDLVALSCANDIGFLLTFALEQLAATSFALPFHDIPSTVPFDWSLTDLPLEAHPENVLIIDDGFMAAVTACAPRTEVTQFSVDDAPLRLVFSSGTTGRPVGVPHSAPQLRERALIAEGLYMEQRPYMALIPMSGASGLITAYANIYSGEPYFSPGTAVDNLRLLRDNHISTVKGSPAQLQELAAAWDGEPLHDLVVVGSVGGPQFPALSRQLTVMAPNAQLINLYGSTESGIIAISTIGADFVSPPAEVASDVVLEIVDDDDTLLPPETPGNVRYRRECQATHYYGDERASLRDGFCYPGDRGVRHVDGSFTILGRSDNLINANGIKVQIEDADAIALSVAGVGDAGFFVTVDQHNSPVLALALVPAPSTDRNDLTAALTLALAAVPMGAIIVTDVIPRNALGKTQRTILRERFPSVVL